MKTDLQNVRLTDLSQVEHAYHLLPVDPESAHRILVVAFAGKYRAGGEGVDDASYMAAVTAAGLQAWNPRGLVFDLIQLTYHWGHELTVALGLGKKGLSSFEEVLLGRAEAIERSDIPTSIVASAENRSAIASLLGEEMSVNPSDWVFDSLDAAVLRVRRELVVRQPR